MNSPMQIEQHPLAPFIPEGCRIMMFGSFPPPIDKWSMEFFYPNWINDMWRIMGVVFHRDAHHFELHGEKRFDRQRIVDFCTTKGIGLYDTATKVRRLEGNASDKFLEVIEPTDIASLLHQAPACDIIVTTGDKASEIIAEQFCCAKPRIGEYTAIKFNNRTLLFYRMPSSSRAYPLSLQNKAEHYERLFSACGLL